MNIMIPCWATKIWNLEANQHLITYRLGAEDALPSTNYEQIHFGTHLDKWVDSHAGREGRFYH